MGRRGSGIRNAGTAAQEHEGCTLVRLTRVVQPGPHDDVGVAVSVDVPCTGHVHGHL
jgi:hypothetical protein